MLFEDILSKVRDPRDLTAMELQEALEKAERLFVVEKKKLFHRCSERACRRLRDCAAEERCVCAGVPPMGRRDYKRYFGRRRSKRNAMRF